MIDDKSPQSWAEVPEPKFETPEIKMIAEWLLQRHSTTIQLWDNYPCLSKPEIAVSTAYIHLILDEAAYYAQFAGDESEGEDD